MFCKDKKLTVKILPWKQNFMIYTGEKLFKSNSRASLSTFFPFGIYLFKVNNGNTRTICEIRSKLTITIPERLQWRHSGVLLLSRNRFHTLFWYFHCWLWTSKRRPGWKLYSISVICHAAYFSHATLIISLSHASCNLTIL